MVSLFLLLGCYLSYIVDLFAALHELASASARTLLKLASSVRALLKPYGDTLRATASKYGESHDSSENSDFFYCVKKTLLVNYFQKYTFEVPASSHFCEIWESSKYSSINQDGRWNLSKIVHFQHASTERRELVWISYSHSL